MVQKLTQIITDIVDNKKTFDNHDMAQIVSIIVKEKKLENYFEKVTFTNIIYNENPDIMYDYEEKRLFINSSLKDSKPIFMNANFKSFSNKDSLIIQILNIIYRLAYELEKINQWQIASSFANNLEAVIIRASILHKILFSGLDFNINLEKLPMSINNMYEKYGRKLANHKTNFNPLVHLANFYAAMLVLDVAMAMPNKTANIINFMQASILENLIKDYKNNLIIPSSPTIDFLNDQNFKNLFKNFSFYNANNLLLKQNIIENVPLARRLQCGLTMKHQELSQIRHQYIELIS